MLSCKGAKLMDGKVFKGNIGHQELAAWVEGLGLYGTDKSELIKEDMDETVFMFALFKCRKFGKRRN